jgi:hypothetical protein
MWGGVHRVQGCKGRNQVEWHGRLHAGTQQACTASIASCMDPVTCKRIRQAGGSEYSLEQRGTPGVTYFLCTLHQVTCCHRQWGPEWGCCQAATHSNTHQSEHSRSKSMSKTRHWQA